MAWTRLWVSWFEPWVSWFQLGIRSWLGLLPEHFHSSCRKQNLTKQFSDEAFTFIKLSLPKHLDRLVCLSMKTFAETMVPKGANVVTRSASENSWGRWQMNRLLAAPSIPDPTLPGLTLQPSAVFILPPPEERILHFPSHFPLWRCFWKLIIRSGKKLMKTEYNSRKVSSLFCWFKKVW